MFRKALVLSYGAAAYLAFLVTLLYTVGFLAGVAVPKGIDDRLVTVPARERARARARPPDAPQRQPRPSQPNRRLQPRPRRPVQRQLPAQIPDSFFLVQSSRH